MGVFLYLCGCRHSYSVFFANVDKKIVDPVQQKGGCWPTHEQELLLKAVLLKGDKARQAWEAWEQATDIEVLDHGSYRLLPPLYRSLLELGVQHPLMPKLKGIYLHTWSKNKVMLHRAATLLEHMQQRGWRTMVLKGAALINLYQDIGIRSMADFDLVVERDCRDEVIAFLAKEGFEGSYAYHPELLDYQHAMNFENNQKQQIDLHWYILSDCIYKGADDAFWQAAIPLKIGNTPTHTLCISDQLLHVCANGIKWNSVPPFYWVADAVMILRLAEPIDWARFVQQTTSRQLTIQVLAALEYLHKVFDADIPTQVLDNLRNTPTTPDEKQIFKINTEPVNWKTALQRHIIVYNRLTAPQHTDTKKYMNKWAFVATHYKHYWQLQHTWQVPFYMVYIAFKRLFSSSK